MFSNSTSPSIFIVYAHDNENEGAAHAWCVRKVVVCDSGLLKRYYERSFTSSYISALEKAYVDGRDFTYQLNKLRDVVESHYPNNGFHHVLTELAFPKLRVSRGHDNNYGIIPVALDQDINMSYIPSRKHCDLVLKLNPSKPVGPHLLFFKLLQQIYPEAFPFIAKFEGCYKTAIEKLEKKAQGITQERIWAIIINEIHKTVEDLVRLDAAALRHVMGISRNELGNFEKSKLK